MGGVGARRFARGGTGDRERLARGRHVPRPVDPRPLRGVARPPPARGVARGRHRGGGGGVAQRGRRAGGVGAGGGRAGVYALGSGGWGGPPGGGGGGGAGGGGRKGPRSGAWTGGAGGFPPRGGPRRTRCGISRTWPSARRSRRSSTSTGCSGRCSRSFLRWGSPHTL